MSKLSEFKTFLAFLIGCVALSSGMAVQQSGESTKAKADQPRGKLVLRTHVAGKGAGPLSARLRNILSTPIVSANTNAGWEYDPYAGGEENPFGFEYWVFDFYPGLYEAGGTSAGGGELPTKVEVQRIEIHGNLQQQGTEDPCSISINGDTALLPTCSLYDLTVQQIPYVDNLSIELKGGLADQVETAIRRKQPKCAHESVTMDIIRELALAGNPPSNSILPMALRNPNWSTIYALGEDFTEELGHIQNPAYNYAGSPWRKMRFTLQAFDNNIWFFVRVHYWYNPHSRSVDDMHLKNSVSDGCGPAVG